MEDRTVGEILMDVDYGKDSGDNPFTAKAFKENLAVMIDLVVENEGGGSVYKDEAAKIIAKITVLRGYIDRYFGEAKE